MSIFYALLLQVLHPNKDKPSHLRMPWYLLQVLAMEVLREWPLIDDVEAQGGEIDLI